MGIGIGAIAVALGAAGAEAQIVIHSPRDVAVCLCQDQTVSNLRDEMEFQKQIYDTSKSEYDALAAEAERQYAELNINDSDAIAAYRQLLERRDVAEANFKLEAAPTYAAVVARYNQAVQSYNATCGGKAYDPDALAAAQNGLYCPR
jgi:hypothetical protein